MSRKSTVTFDGVVAVADAMVAEGLTPSARSIRGASRDGPREPFTVILKHGASFDVALLTGRRLVFRRVSSGQSSISPIRRSPIGWLRGSTPGRAAAGRQ